MANSRFAFATLVTSDSYANGALVVASALKELHLAPPTPPEVAFQTVCIVTPETVDVAIIKKLRQAFDIVFGVEIIEENQTKGLQLLGRPDLHLVLTKLHVFRLTQFDKIIFLDADVLPVRPLSHLFTLPHEFSAVPDVGWPDIFNSGVMVLTPGEDKFNEIMDVIKTRGSWDGGDQGVLNEWRGNNWNRLSFTYNTTPTAAYTYAPAYERFGSQISAIHFIGPNKPWSSAASRTPFAHSAPPPSSPPTTQQSYGYNQLVDRWFDVYDRNFRAPRPEVQQSVFHFEKYEPAWSDKAPAVTSGGLGLEELKRLAIEGMSKVHTQVGEGQYQSLPLEGRIDLMRPSPPVPPPVLPTTVPVSDLPPHLTTSLRISTHQPEVRPVDVVETAPLHVHAPAPEPTHVESVENSPQPSSPPSLLPPHHHEPPEVQPLTVSLETTSLVLPALPGPESLPEPESLPPRPHSPTMLVWNPAFDPPPTNKPITPSIETLGQAYVNAWDLLHTRRHRQDSVTHSSFDSAWETSPPRPAHPEDFFAIPPTHEIPERLVKEGTYSNVTHHEADYSKVTNVFPWEQRQRQVPARAFPASEAPPPNIQRAESPEPPAPLLTVEEPTPEKTPVSIRNPRTHRELYYPATPTTHGMPGSIVYTNAWDNIPSIQRYANTLVKPIPEIVSTSPPSSKRRKQPQEPAPLQPIEDDHDGDDEDTSEGSSSGDEKPKSASSSRRSSVPSRGSHRGSAASPEHKRPRTRTGSILSASSKEYKSEGMQTVPKSRKHQSTQTEEVGIFYADSPRADALPAAAPPETTPPPRLNINRLLKAGGYSPAGPLSPRMADSTSASPPGAGERPIPSIDGQIKKPSTPTRDPQSPVALGSPFQQTRFKLSPTQSPREIVPSSPSMASTATLRDQSTLTGESNRLSWMSTTSGTSDATIASPISTTVSPDLAHLAKKVSAGRKWDPARGVDVFKRDSQEVLAKFLKMGQWSSSSETTQV
ncbi:uncharacterized protein EI90DRAFT_2991551 [Cantharellus anzutake]|uniref:uncharacterized protein n=1 Tax=Cantharellus anzutake TaxID=1750568 RepID=UPI00190578A9|nr:uncharacterized protein EI90DRAFT_2991551 [Cantharellus anzutake]KAF8338293.1 hypothetical protein EI90DRAFT_2991551 [Cantharellus anzutake]